MEIVEVEKNEAIVTTVLSQARGAFTELFLDEEVINWLNKPLNKSYVEALEKIEKASKLLSIKDFIRGHRTLAKRHTRGKALRLASVDKAIDLSLETDVKKEILELADEYLKRIEEQNLTSLSNLVTTASKDSTIKEYLQAAFKELPVHLKIVLEALKESHDSQGVTETALETLKTLFPPTHNSGYSPEKIISRTTSNFLRTNRLIQKFGVVLTGDSKTPFIKIENSEKLKESLGVEE